MTDLQSNVYSLEQDQRFGRCYSRSRATTNKLFVVALLALQGCASTTAPVRKTTSPQIASPAPESVAASEEILTVENLLRWPLEGPSGVDRTIAGLRQVFTMEELTTGELYGKEPVTLSDGYILGSTTLSPEYKSIHVHPQQAPCFSPERAIEITGAVMDPVFRSEHGVDLGHTYNVTRNGVRVSFTSTPETYKCVYTIHVWPARKVQP